ncbi:hypothetical protein D9611_000815 [Ephemerocybe angulata]|uniref:Uncharacterized protein n=1 Tax=Ephemerocybe angulata TaxID=980116 RepID=A0A8H5BPW4_9AGAR|nr:hypothetical protein D9611_000815 [Tulosesus angulatus]
MGSLFKVDDEKVLGLQVLWEWRQRGRGDGHIGKWNMRGQGWRRARVTYTVEMLEPAQKALTYPAASGSSTFATRRWSGDLRHPVALSELWSQS